MPIGPGGQRQDNTDWHRRALTAGGAGLWEWDHRRESARLCAGAAEMLAGDAVLAWHELPLHEALSRVHADDVARLRARLRDARHPSSIQIGPCRVNGTGGARTILLRGHTRPGVDGQPGHTMGIVVDVTEGPAMQTGWHAGQAEGALDEAAHHAIAAFNAIRATGLTSLTAPARALLLAIGRELASPSRSGGGWTH